MLLPRRERINNLLGAQSKAFGFSIERFPFTQVSDQKFTSQLKCQAYYFAVSELKSQELLLFVDADTCCARNIIFAEETIREIRSGGVGLVPDIEDRHFQSPTDPWYLAPGERLAYVNSGVILTSKKSLPLFKRFRQLSEQPSFLTGPFNDQKVINFCLGKEFGDRLVVLGRKYNWIGPPFGASAVILHHAGGAGWLGQQRRKERHQAHCAQLLQKTRAAARPSDYEQQPNPSLQSRPRRIQPITQHT